MRKKQTKWQIWEFPSVLGVLTITGLISALLFESGGDLISWATLSAPVFVAFYYCMTRKDNYNAKDI